MVTGLNAIVWERDPETFAVRWVNDRVVELLGHPLQAWYDDPGLWRDMVHPDDREEAGGPPRRPGGGRWPPPPRRRRATGLRDRVPRAHRRRPAALAAPPRSRRAGRF